MRNLLPLLALLALSAGCAADQALLMEPSSRAASPDALEDDVGYDNSYGDDDDSDGAGADDDSDPSPPSGVAVAWIEPSGEGHHYRRPLRIGFTGNAIGSTLRVSGADGVALPTTVEWSDDGTEMTAWVRDGDDAPSSQAAWLQPDTRYSAELDLGQTYGVFDFQTSSVGTEAPDGLAVTGQAYVFDVTAALAPSLPGLVPLLETVSAGAGWLWQFREAEDDGDGLDLEAGLGTGPDPAAEQDSCAPTARLGVTDTPVSFARAPFFESAPGLFLLETGVGTLEFEKGWLDGDVAPDGAALVEVGFRGWLRPEGLDELFGVDLCSVAPEQVGGSCEACPSGEGECLWVELRGLRADALSTELLSNPDPTDGDCVDASPSYVACSAAGAGGSILVFLPLLALRRRRGAAASA